MDGALARGDRPAGAVLVTACTSTGTRSPWWQQTGTSRLWPAGPDARGRAGDVAGHCAANFVIPAVKVTVHVGQHIDVHMPGGVNWLYRDSLCAVFPLPYSSRPSVVARTTISTTRQPARSPPGTRACDAVHHRALLGGGQIDSRCHGKCPALDITVLP